MYSSQNTLIVRVVIDTPGMSTRVWVHCETQVYTTFATSSVEIRYKCQVHLLIRTGEACSILPLGELLVKGELRVLPFVFQRMSRLNLYETHTMYQPS